MFGEEIREIGIERLRWVQYQCMEVQCPEKNNNEIARMGHDALASRRSESPECFCPRLLFLRGERRRSSKPDAGKLARRRGHRRRPQYHASQQYRQPA